MREERLIGERSCSIIRPNFLSSFRQRNAVKVGEERAEIGIEIERKQLTVLLLVSGVIKACLYVVLDANEAVDETVEETCL